MEVTVSEAVAQYFYEQCCGAYTGHMAHTPNNPVIDGLIKAHRCKKPEDFARFLRQVADHLEQGDKF